MAIPSAKLLKIGGPILTGIGGVIATSSLVSKNADEKPEEKLKTAALQDEEPTIDPYKDQNESEQREEKQDENEGRSKASADDQKSEPASESAPSGENQEKDQSQGSEGNGQQKEPSASGNDGAGEGSDQQALVGQEQKPKGQENGTEAQQGADSSQKGDLEAQDGEQSDQDVGDSGGGKDGSSEASGGVTTEGSETADHNNAMGTAYGNIDRAMTKTEREQLIGVKDTLEDMVKRLSAISP
ncbi:hypothetical protein MHF_1069 [Mycoplasma haemofelis Ohio2]|uniref:Uncharacterized protein n=1 Tax=Mycoplasma haemofelis (strain Ohio2) TaxID=859194 RepID=F6FJG4_MYCHI|nr:hypothetical protein MHF_1069 [Mycoplasma haemofelis Ohio2]